MEGLVEITVEGIQTPMEMGEQERYRTVSRGECFFRQGSHYLRYLETLEGEGAPSPSLIKLWEGGFSLRRSGQVKTHMRFEEGLIWQDAYLTPLGSLPMTIETHFVRVQVKENLVLCEASYTLSLCGSPLSRSQIRVVAVPLT